MTSSELMIYDWCYMKKKGTEDWNTLMCFHTSDSDFLDYEGIPLDDDILKANGWRDTSIRFCHDKVDFSIGYSDALGYPLRTNYSEDTFVIIQYVHQLQQVLRLCGHSELANHFKLK